MSIKDILISNTYTHLGSIDPQSAHNELPGWDNNLSSLVWGPDEWRLYSFRKYMRASSEISNKDMV